MYLYSIFSHIFLYIYLLIYETKLLAVIWQKLWHISCLHEFLQQDTEITNYIIRDRNSSFFQTLKQLFFIEVYTFCFQIIYIMFIGYFGISMNDISINTHYTYLSVISMIFGNPRSMATKRNCHFSPADLLHDIF